MHLNYTKLTKSGFMKGLNYTKLSIFFLYMLRNIISHAYWWIIVFRQENPNMYRFYCSTSDTNKVKVGIKATIAHNYIVTH